ncbi:hypothetical protein GOV14_04890 [Candidatus Pacearchaeota archaeon]|nr:hypothetical protein [Candidatus Pacearchaeota archaeon]
MTQNLSSICRTYALVDFQDKPYDSHLASSIETVKEFDDSFSAYKEKREEVAKIQQELEQTPVDEGFLTGFKKILSSGKKKIEDIAQTGAIVLKNQERLKSLQDLVNGFYNTQAKTVHSLSSAVKSVKGLIRDYESNKQHLGDQISKLHELHSDPEKLNTYLVSLVDKNNTSDKEISEQEKLDVVKNLKREGERELTRLSKEFLEIQNDLPLAQRLLGYEAVIDTHNDLADCFYTLKQSLDTDIQKIDKVVLLYDKISSAEIMALQSVHIPEQYIAAVNRLVEGIQKVDSEFTQKCLEKGFSPSTLNSLDEVEFNGVIPELIRHVESVHNKNSQSKDTEQDLSTPEVSVA